VDRICPRSPARSRVCRRLDLDGSFARRPYGADRPGDSCAEAAGVLACGMRTLGLVSNPLSFRNQRSDGLKAAASRLGLPFAQPATPGELRQSMTEFRMAGVDVVAVAGGDGTLREVLGACSAIGGYEPDF